MDSAATFVVRIYRRSRIEGEELSGVVESVRDGAVRSFSSFDELCALLKYSIWETPDRHPGVTKKCR